MPPLLRPQAGRAETRDPPPRRGQPDAANPERAKDQEFFSDFYPGLKPLLSKSSGAPYWKGPLSLVDGSRAEVVAMEDPGRPRAVLFDRHLLARIPAIADILRAVQANANSARRGTPCCISNATSIRRFTAARRGRGT